MRPAYLSQIQLTGPILEELEFLSQTTELLEKPHQAQKSAWLFSTTSMPMESNGTMWPATTGSPQSVSQGNSQYHLPFSAQESTNFSVFLNPLPFSGHHVLCFTPEETITVFSILGNIYINYYLFIYIFIKER